MAMPQPDKQYGGSSQPSDLAQNEPPAANAVEHLHTNADTDVRPQALHHTLGYGPNQSSPGDHRHDGTTSQLLFEKAIITGSKTDGTAVNSIIQLLVRFGAEDQTT